jgi:thioesterase domain-containing protein
MRPAEIVPLAALPRLANGKVDLIGLAHMDHERADRASPEVEEVAEPGIASAAGGAVRDCWSRCISARSWQLDSRFDDAGGDSLNAMELLLALERRLRRKLPVGLLTPDMRPSELTARLNDPLRSATHTHEDEPTIVFVPNSFGANLIFAEIIARMREHFEVRHTDHREIIEQAMRPVDAEQYIALVQRTAVTGGARKRLWFVGYAGGGRIAAEVARRLIAQGVPVEFVAVLDGQDSVWREARTRHPANRSLFPPLRDRIANDGGLIAFVITRSLIRFVLLAMRLENYKMMQLGVRILALLGLREGANYALRLVLMRVRNDALGELPKKPLPMPITLFVSAASHPSGYVPPADRGWSPHCTGVSVVEIEGDRMAMLAGEGAAAIITALRSADERLRVRKKA